MKTITAKKKNSEKWNRSHEFSYKKKTSATPRHATYAFEKRKNKRKYLIFTSNPSTHGVSNVPLRKNIDPTSNGTTYVRDGYFIDTHDKFEPVNDKRFMIDKSDKDIINILKKKPFHKK